MENSVDKKSIIKAFAIQAVALIGTIAAFASGASALGMVLIVVTISALGMGAGTIMNSPAPTPKK